VKIALRKEKQIRDTNANISISSTNFIKITWADFFNNQQAHIFNKEFILYIFFGNECDLFLVVCLSTSFYDGLFISSSNTFAII
jgi:hypothetical protein